MDYRTVTDVNSKQYELIYSDDIIVGNDGLLYSGEYVGVALASRFGNVGDKFIITLDTGQEFKAVKLDEKADAHTYNGCHHRMDGSVVEFVVCTNRMQSSYPNVLRTGSFDNTENFRGNVIRIRKVVVDGG